MLEAGHGPTTDLRDHLSVLRQRKWVVVSCVVLVTAIGVLASLRQDKVYSAQAEVLLSRSAAQDNGITTEIRLFRSEEVRDRARDALPGAARASAASVGESRVVAVTAESTDPEHAAASVMATVDAYIDFRREQQLAGLLDSTRETQARIDELEGLIAALDGERQQRLDEVAARFAPVPGESDVAEVQREDEADAARDDVERLIGSKRDAFVREQIALQVSLGNIPARAEFEGDAGGPQIISPALVPSDPIRPDPVSDALTAFGIALILGIALAFLFEYVDDTIKDRNDLERALGGETPVIGIIPTVSEWRDKSQPFLISIDLPQSAAAEAYRTLRTALQFVSVDRPLHRIAVTSANPKEGKSSTVANIAVLLARADHRVTIVSGDLRRPRVQDYFGLPSEPGVTSVMIGDVGLGEALRQIPGTETLLLLPSGPIPPNPSELLASPRFDALLDELSMGATVLLVDAPPVLPVTDAAVIAAAVDGVLLVVSAGRNTRKQIRRTLEILRQVGTPVIGAVLNQVGASDLERYDYRPLEPGRAASSQGGRTRSSKAKQAKPGKRSKQPKRARSTTGQPNDQRTPNGKHAAPTDATVGPGGT